MFGSVKKFALPKWKIPELYLSQFLSYAVFLVFTRILYFSGIISKETDTVFTGALILFFILFLIIRILFLEYFLDKFSKKLLEKYSRTKLILVSLTPLLIFYGLFVLFVEMSIKQIK